MDESFTATMRAANPADTTQGQLGVDKQTKYVINNKQIVKSMVGLSNRVATTDIQEAMQVRYVATAFTGWKWCTEIHSCSTKGCN